MTGGPPLETRELLERTRTVADDATAVDPTLLRDLVGGDIPVTTLVEVGRRLEGVSPERLGFAQEPRPVRVAITASFTTSGLVPLLRVLALHQGIEPQFHLSGFGQFEADLQVPGSALREFGPDLTLCLLHDGWFVPRGWSTTQLAALASALEERRQRLEELVESHVNSSRGWTVLHTVPLSPNEYRAVISFEGRARLARTWRQLNIDLIDLAERLERTCLLDVESVFATGTNSQRDERLYRFGGIAWTLSQELAYAREAVNVLRAQLGLSRKALVVDLDNTVWGGVLGDDGPAGIQIGGLYPGNCYEDLQHRIAGLADQGVVVALCSKNEETAVHEVLSDHPDMVLGTRHVAAQAVNWCPKDQNIRELADELNLGRDSLVFLDDSPFEVGLVRRTLPEVEVVDLVTDPADRPSALLSGGLFDVLGTTADDQHRTERYQAATRRNRSSREFDSYDEYLRHLEVTVTVREADAFSLPRLEQLERRTNQFTMTGRSRGPSRPDVHGEAWGPLVLGFSVADRYADEGIVGGVWVARFPDHWLLENFVMSCRVFSRGVETTVLQHVVDSALDAGVRRLDAVFRDTGRNGPAAALYPSAGFARKSAGDEGEVLYSLPLTSRPAFAPYWTRLRIEDS
ncbi:HAD-IIIC family phosphatase [Streptomyces sp. NPDC005438]|uniref:HAD-IIIC family phosphatase n=1 Tax=Streptomyces sp. NPDC005438 TaxID=3156880 RepID=UPI00339EE315